MGFIKSVISPIFLIVAILIAGMISLIRRRKNLSIYFIGSATLLICLLSSNPFSNLLLWNLERRYPPIDDFENITGVNYIVVLSAWDSDNPTVPYSSNMGYSSALRVLEANRIYNNLPHCKVIISGGPVSTKLMARLTSLLGMKKENIIIDNQASNTLDSAVNAKKLISEKPFILVTSAIHLPRAMKSFQQEGLRPVPAPADFLYGYYKNYNMPFNKPVDYYFPNVEALRHSHLAIYEYIGMYFYQLKHFLLHL